MFGYFPLCDLMSSNMSRMCLDMSDRFLRNTMIAYLLFVSINVAKYVLP